MARSALSLLDMTHKLGEGVTKQVKSLHETTPAPAIEAGVVAELLSSGYLPRTPNQAHHV